MRARVTKVFKFEAAHRLPRHDGKCANQHGHSYRVEVTCEGKIHLGESDPKRGMVIDFTDLKTFWEGELKPLLDHRDLNESLDGKVVETTAECIAEFVCHQYIAGGFPVKMVSVWETDTSFASVLGSEVLLNGD